MNEFSHRANNPEEPWDVLDEFQTITVAALAGSPDDPDPTAENLVAIGMKLGEDGAMLPVDRSIASGRGMPPPYRSPDQPASACPSAKVADDRSRRLDAATCSLASDTGSWQDNLPRAWPGLLDCEISIKPGLFDLVVGIQTLVDEASEAAHFLQIKEKFGGPQSGLSAGRSRHGTRRLRRKCAFHPHERGGAQERLAGNDG